MRHNEPASADRPAPLADLRAFLDASPSPWHVADTARQRLVAAGFQEVLLGGQWVEAVERGFVVRGAAVVAWDDRGATPTAAMRLVGAHTDSPCLRIKPRPDVGTLGWRQLGVEVYGGVLLNSWLDRDLGIAGRVVLDGGNEVDVMVDAPICRIPQLAIHLDRDISDRGLVLDKQQHLTPVWGTGTSRHGDFAAWLAGQIDTDRHAIRTWDLCLFDRTPAAVLGADGSMLASGRLDNQLSCWAALDALIGRIPNALPGVIALFDHEEVGSDSVTGAAGPLLEHVLERLALARGLDRAAHLARLASSMCVSADNAHAVHPNYVERHEPDHRPIVNHGPAIKLNANQRYATTARAAAELQRCFEAADVRWQTFVSRNNMPCGSTIGPITATRLGIETVDVGVPQLSMHSARELCGVEDPVSLAVGLRAWFDGAATSG
jgi:aspartyl aminopeptidase